MGEKIRNLSSFKIREKDVCIELNDGQDVHNDFDIHIETPMFRFSMDDSEFMKFASAVIEARRKLADVKRIEG